MVKLLIGARCNMPALEGLAITLGTAVAKTACNIWLGSNNAIEGASTNALDVGSYWLMSPKEKRQYRRLWDQTAEIVADRIAPFVDREFRDLAENEKVAAIEAVTATFDRQIIREEDLFAHDLDAAYLDKQLRRQDPNRASLAGLSEAGSSLYDLLLREGSAYIIEIVRTLPQAEITALTEILRRERQIVDDMREMLERLPARRGVDDFESDYRQLVANQLDHIEFYGATVSDVTRRYPLSIAYLSLKVSGNFVLTRVEGAIPGTAPKSMLGPVRVTEVLSASKRLFIRGQAGLGKTTLLQWIAVQSARRGFAGEMQDWNATVPFFIPLRRYSSEPLPPADRFIESVGRHIAEEMPTGWVQEQLRTGRAVVLIDGVDEFAEGRRDEARTWLRELMVTFPAARFIITTRPAATPADWLGRDEFQVAELEPMEAVDIPTFVKRWHDAMRDQCTRQDECDDLNEYEKILLESLQGSRHLRQLAGYPLLCALLCALNKDSRAQLPNNRMELYDIALQMLLERRDRERQIKSGVVLSRTEKTILLQSIAYWLIRNGWSYATKDQVIDRIRVKLKSMSGLSSVWAEKVCKVLLERSGLLREPIEGQIDFVHRSFQEYLAGAEAIDAGDIGILVDHAHLDQWSDVIILAAGHASPRERRELLLGLLGRADQVPKEIADALKLVAVASLETSADLAQDARSTIEKAARSILPPKTMATARSLSRLGPIAFDLLRQASPRTGAEVAATVRTVSDLDDPSVISFLSQFNGDRRIAVNRELLRAWANFDPVEYAERVLSRSPLDAGSLEIVGRRYIPALKHLGNLSSLTCFLEDDRSDLSFIHDLPKLAELHIVGAGLSTLEALADSAIEGLGIYGIDRFEEEPLDLFPLARASRLTRLHVWPRRVTNLLSVLQALPDISDLSVGFLGRVQEIPALPKLESLGFGRASVEDGDLDYLSFAPKVSHLTIQESRVHKAAWSALAQWKNSLSTLVFREMPEVDLTPLANTKKRLNIVLNQIEYVDGLELLLEADAVRELRLIYYRPARVPDLTVLRGRNSLKELTLSFRANSEIDLTPLSGVRFLQVRVPAGVPIRGAEGLGQYSSVHIE
ncbi:NACHT domain-containing protein [Micromonospora sp. NPDC005413]|uniref:NACHT domain-containing protein n=1 Tax=Micromonospora sp. NPDC005413 TaxID=3154563 RepID=UPI0033B03B08